MDFEQTFRNRDKTSPLVEVKFGNFTFKIARFAQPVQSAIVANANEKTMIAVSEKKTQNKIDAVFQYIYLQNLKALTFTHLQTHIRDWVHTPKKKKDEPIVFNAENLKGILQSMSLDEANKLTDAYGEALAKDNKRENKDPLSKKDSKKA